MRKKNPQWIIWLGRNINTLCVTFKLCLKNVKNPLFLLDYHCHCLKSHIYQTNMIFSLIVPYIEYIFSLFDLWPLFSGCTFATIFIKWKHFSKHVCESTTARTKFYLNSHVKFDWATNAIKLVGPTYEKRTGWVWEREGGWWWMDGRCWFIVSRFYLNPYVLHHTYTMKLQNIFERLLTYCKKYHGRWKRVNSMLCINTVKKYITKATFFACQK